LLAKYNKDTYEKYLRPIYEYCEELRTVGVPKDGWKTFLASKPQDMKSNWLCLKRGGPDKSQGVKRFCPLCKIRSNDIAPPNLVQCLTFVDNGPACDGCDLKCFNRPVMDAKTIRKRKYPECDFEKYYDDCKLYMMDVDRQAGMYDIIMDTNDSIKCMSETLDMFGLLELC
jgi:hypothetical protein